MVRYRPPQTSKTLIVFYHRSFFPNVELLATKKNPKNLKAAYHRSFFPNAEVLVTPSLTTLIAVCHRSLFPNAEILATPNLKNSNSCLTIIALLSQMVRYRPPQTSKTLIVFYHRSFFPNVELLATKKKIQKI